METKTSRIALLAGLCAALAAPALITTPAAAQTTVEELTVIGRYGPGGEPQSLSQAVSYADLNLASPADQAEFRHRIRLTARYLCERLGEDETSTSIAPSCRQAAERDGLAQAASLIHAFAPRGTTWVAGPAWAAPYPGEWVRTYP